MKSNVFQLSLRINIGIRNGKIVWKLVLFAAGLEFPKILIPRLPQNSSNVNNECARMSKQP